MSEENQPNTITDPAKTGPNSLAEKAGSNWEMPAPIFRVSEGVTVSKKPGEPAPEKGAQIVHEPLPDSPPDKTAGADSAGGPGTEEVVLTPVPAKKPSFSFLGFLMTAVGILGMIVFLIAILGLAYFYFIYRAATGAE